MAKGNFHRGLPPFFSWSGVIFPHLKELALHLNSVVEREWWPVVGMLFRKFPNVEELTILGGFPQDGNLTPEFLARVSLALAPYMDRRTALTFFDFGAQHLEPFVEAVVPKTVAGRLMIKAKSTSNEN